MLKSYLQITLIISFFSSVGGFLPTAQEVDKEEAYRVGKQDVLRIEVAGDQDFTREAATVSESGTINYPVLGDLKIEGLSLIEIGEMIRNLLIERKLLTQPAVSVSVKEYRSQSVTVLGEVRSTGKYYLKGREKLFDKIVEAGGLTPNAGEIVISRTTTDGTQNIVVRARDLIGDATVLKAGDVILVRTREVTQVYVSGEVVSGRALNYVEGMTVSQAVLMAGGLNRFGSKSKVTIKRVVGGNEKLTKVNLAEIEKGKMRDFPLLPNDTIIVGRRVF